MSARRTITTWSAEDDARLTEMYAEGLTYMVIAERLGFSRSKVAGRCDRLRLSGKRPIGRPSRRAESAAKPGPKPKKAPKPKLVGRARGREAMTALPMPQTPQQPPKPVLVRPARPSDVIWRPKTCQFPHGTPGKPDFGFCDAPIVPDGRAYCDTHAARCYLPRKDYGDKVAG
jgi:GcrA cell cycle regulator